MVNIVVRQDLALNFWPRPNL